MNRYRITITGFIQADSRAEAENDAIEAIVDLGLQEQSVVAQEEA